MPIASASFTNSACAQTSGMALPLGRPGASAGSGIGAASQTCSGIMPFGPVIRAIACSQGSASSPAISARWPRSPVSSGQPRPMPVPSNGAPSACSP